MFRKHGIRTTSWSSSLHCPLGSFPVSWRSATSQKQTSFGTEEWQLPNGTALQEYRDSGVIVQTALGKYTPQLPQGLHVDGSLAAVLCVQTLAPLPWFLFECGWADPMAGVDGGPTSGEGLEALTWQTNNAVISLGTEDSEFLRGRARRGQSISRGLAEKLGPNTVRYSASGLQIKLIVIPNAYAFQVHFLLAWNFCEDAENNLGTWFAVEQDHNSIVAQLAGESQ
jgi:hypothetical protein